MTWAGRPGSGGGEESGPHTPDPLQSGSVGRSRELQEVREAGQGQSARGHSRRKGPGAHWPPPTPAPRLTLCWALAAPRRRAAWASVI